MTDNIEDNKQAAYEKLLECPYQNKCGGCENISMPYAQQLEEKQRLCEKYLASFCRVEKICAMAYPYHYRNKISAAVAQGKNKEIISGVYEKGSHRVVSVDYCLIEDERADAVISTIRGLLKSFKLMPYDEDRGTGLIRHVQVRVGKKSGQIMVVIVVASQIFPSKNNFVKVLTAKHPEISTIVLNVNNKRTSMVLGERDIVIYGRGYINDELCGLNFRISPRSFYQINPLQTQRLYKKAIQMAQLKKDDVIIDAYCGIGTIGLIASSQVANVIGLELNADAVSDAKLNAKENKIKNITFIQADAGRFLKQMADDNARANVVFMDPPRTGSSEAFLSALVKMAPAKVVYISCNPITQARDLAYLTKYGYEAILAAPFDMFPHTEHVEVICCLSRQNDR